MSISYENKWNIKVKTTNSQSTILANLNLKDNYIKKIVMTGFADYLSLLQLIDQPDGQAHK